jgi:hypothetical protein
MTILYPRLRHRRDVGPVVPSHGYALDLGEAFSGLIVGILPAEPKVKFI